MTEDTNRPIACIYHHPCNDGFTAAWIVWSYFNKIGIDVDLIPGDYTEEPPLDRIKGKDVFIVDYSYKSFQLQQVIDVANTTTVIDHHKTALPLLDANLTGEVNLRINMKYSGAMLTWQHFYPEESPPMLVLYVQDRDLWTKELPGCDAIHAYITSRPFTMDTWDILRDVLEDRASWAEAMAVGRDIENWITKWLREHIAANVYTVNCQGYTVPCCNVPGIFASEAGDIMDEMCDGPFSISYEEQVSSYRYSLRSKTNFDVSVVAAIYGGGGHAAAAGFHRAKAKSGLLPL